MDIPWNEWTFIVLGIMTLIVIIGVAIFFYKKKSVWSDRAKDFVKQSIPISKRIRNAVLFVVVAEFALLTVANMSTGAHEAPMSYTTETSIAKTEAFGLVPGHTYSLELGSLSSTSSSSASATGGFFHAHASVQTEAGPAVMVSFEYEGNTYPLMIPIRVTTFDKDDVADPTVTIYFRSDPNFTFDEYHEESWPVYEQRWVNFVYVHELVEPSVTTTTRETLSADAMRIGLATIAEPYIESATIVLSHEMYDQLTGKIE